MNTTNPQAMKRRSFFKLSAAAMATIAVAPSALAMEKKECFWIFQKVRMTEWQLVIHHWYLPRDMSKPGTWYRLGRAKVIEKLPKYPVGLDAGGMFTLDEMRRSEGLDDWSYGFVKNISGKWVKGTDDIERIQERWVVIRSYLNFNVPQDGSEFRAMPIIS